MASLRLVFAAMAMIVVADTSRHVLAEKVAEPNAQAEGLSWCWHECVEYGEAICGARPKLPKNPYRGNRRLESFEGPAFKRPLPDPRPSHPRSAPLETKPIDKWTFEEKCLAIAKCNHVEGSAVPCGWCQTGLQSTEGFSATCRRDGQGSCYPRALCPGTWTWQSFRCPLDGSSGCYQPCKFQIKKCVHPDFDSRPKYGSAEIVDEDFKYYPDLEERN